METFLKGLILSIVLASKIHLCFIPGKIPEFENRPSPRCFIKLKVNFGVRESRTQHLYKDQLSKRLGRNSVNRNNLQAALERCRLKPLLHLKRSCGRSLETRQTPTLIQVCAAAHPARSAWAGGFCFPKSEIFIIRMKYWPTPPETENHTSLCSSVLHTKPPRYGNLWRLPKRKDQTHSHLTRST